MSSNLIRADLKLYATGNMAYYPAADVNVLLDGYEAKIKDLQSQLNECENEKWMYRLKYAKSQVVHWKSMLLMQPDKNNVPVITRLKAAISDWSKELKVCLEHCYPSNSKE